MSRRFEQLLLALVLAAVRAWFLGRCRIDDARYAAAQRRGSRLARRMHRDGSLREKSPVKVVRIGGHQ